MGAENDFNEAQVKAMLGRSSCNTCFCRWIEIGGNCCGVRLNWIVWALAIAMTWGFAIGVLNRPDDEEDPFAKGQQWVTQNFTWLYIITQDVWCLFLIYLGFSRFGSLKLGKDDEKPRYNDFTWFAMLFTCGVAVGLYVFGVAEPLYFYRQPVNWHTWSYDYNHDKLTVSTDAQRAQQAIFMAIYHWGIHGWVPYILLALNVGIVSFRWGMPMTIRSCFYPLLGDNALGLFGDFIDALSMGTTTFGVCTSLGLGVTQLVGGLEYVMHIGCKIKDNCEDAGGVWNTLTYGSEMCMTNATATATAFTGDFDRCGAEWLTTPERTLEAKNWTIVLITIVATVSVLTGLDRGIKTLAKMAFSLGMVVMMICLMGDNTWYLLNVMVQTTGFYLANVVQVGFDCEAFQSLGYEWGLWGFENLLEGSDGEDSVVSKLAAEGISVTLTSNDCGNQANPCEAGMITATAGLMMLKSFNLSPKSISDFSASISGFANAYGISAPVACGSTDQTDYEAATGLTCTNCGSLWTTDLPRCPATVTKDMSMWGTCSTWLLNCPITAAYYDDTNPRFMDWWTIFYWAWWITWAPFVGFFVALISRGRTVREVIIGGFIRPTLFAILWFSVFGGLAIKMQRTAEMALQVRPDHGHTAVECREHYSGGMPITPESKQLAEAGYYMLTCIQPSWKQIYLVMMPYGNLQGLLHFTLWLGLVIYFITSSDSGSMTDDIIGASGLSAGFIPPWQKIFWCCTEGLVAIALINKKVGGVITDQSRSIRALSIVIGLPYTFFLCFMVPATYRVLKKEMGDSDIKAAKKFNTQLLDILEGFQPKGSVVPPMTHVASFLTACFLPGYSVFKCYKKVWPADTCGAILYLLGCQGFLIAFVVCHILETSVTHAYLVAWLMYFGGICLVVHLRAELRAKYNVWGSAVDDIFASVFLPQFSLSQITMMADTDGEGAPFYFASADEVIGEMADAMGQSKDVVTSSA